MLGLLLGLLTGQVRGTSRNDSILTGPLRDNIDALAGNDTIRSGHGDDTIRGGAGNDYIIAGEGTDTAVFSGSVRNYSWMPDPINPLLAFFGLSNGFLRVVGRDGVDRLNGVEILKFDDATIYLTPQNKAPVSVADSYSLTEDQNKVFTPLENDSDPDGDAVTVSIVSGPAHGTVVFDVNNVATYTPIADYFGTDSFTYKLNDGKADGNTVTVSLTVAGVNDTPVATEDGYTFDEDGVLTIDTAHGVLSNDTDADSDALTAKLVAGVSSGKLVLNADGSFTYTPDADFNGTDSFTYTVNDGTVDGNTVTVTLTGTAVNDLPVAAEDRYEVDEGDKLTVLVADGVLANDNDADNDALSAILVDDVTNGTLVLSADGSFVYTPKVFFNGEDSFTYKVNDGTADGNTVTVTIDVASVNNAPFAENDSFETTEDTPLVIDSVLDSILGNDLDPDGDTTTAVKAFDPSNGTLVLNADGTFTYTPDADFFGEDSFTYTANDGVLDSDPATVTITVTAQNDAPVAVADEYFVAEDGSLTVSAGDGVLSNDSDPDNDDLTAILVSNVAHGTLSLSADGSFTYTPDEDFSRVDSFTYKVNDGTVDGNTVTVLIDIDGSADPAPTAISLDDVANGKLGLKIVPEDGADGTGDAIASAGDVNGDGLDDLLIGAYLNGDGGTDAGAAYIIFGSVLTPAVIDLADLGPETGFKLTGENAGDIAGASVSTAGDFNGDGLVDFVIGAWGNDFNTGAAYVIFGTETPADINLDDIATGSDAGFKISGEAFDDWASVSVSCAGDVDGDGLDDLIIGSNNAGGSDARGAAYLIYGTEEPEAIDLASIVAGAGLKINGEEDFDIAGQSVSGIGDFNDDGYTDFIIGAPGNGSGGAAYVIFGNETRPASIDLADVATGTGEVGFKIIGEAGESGTGYSVSGAGDVNGDLVDDVLIGATSGATYVVYGGETVGSTPVSLVDVAAGNGGFKITGGNSPAGTSVSSAGDVNGDGLVDMLIGAFQEDVPAYLIFGTGTGHSSFDLSHVGTTVAGFAILPESADDRATGRVAAAGDLNGDGFDDLAIGVVRYPNPTPDVEHITETYVIYGDEWTL